ncbi:MAG TPA: hypothetical protein PLN42_00445 [Anaerolineae bacterium]|nr:hypothetical protein [Anaerolineae bacterium]
MERLNRWINPLLWVIYLALLAVLLPHTAWAFAVFEPDGQRLVAWSAAFAFEASIAALTYKLMQRIETAPRRKSAWVRWRGSYLNVYAGGLLVAVAVSALANWSHALEFGTATAATRQFPMLAGVLPVAFGAILPGVSFIFAHVLADVAGADVDADPELERAKKEAADLRRELREAERRIAAAEARAAEAEGRFAAAGDLFARLMAESKRERILAAAERWPSLQPAAVAIIAGASPSYVSEVLSGALD